MFRLDANHLNRQTWLRMSSGGARPEIGTPTPGAASWLVSDVGTELSIEGTEPHVRIKDDAGDTATFKIE